MRPSSSGTKFVVVGATGKVGREVLSILLSRGVSAHEITAAASPRSAGSILSVRDERFFVLDTNDLDFSDHCIAIFCAGSEVSKSLAPEAIRRGCYVIDNSSCFRMEDDVPLIIPEINFSDLKNYPNPKLISNPNCSTIQMLMAIKPLHDVFNVKEIVVSTYQSVSGAGQKGVEELLLQTPNSLLDNPITPKHFKKQIAFNVIPQIDMMTDSLYTKEELKMIYETKKILNLPDISITATCVRVPVFVGHSVSVFAKFEDNVDIEVAREAFDKFPGVKVVDDPGNNYITPVDAAGLDEVFISRIRRHPSIPNALSFWCVSDNLRKGAALNAVQIALQLLEESDRINTRCYNDSDQT
ncbi:MAG: aspartate-semialdehyde dehydrogenase [Holosporales bacterium]|jgi:aspartate-semialdehyde dehydrogenase|nr:aspartate-semialdehyde dehydrogenase [Holosporales bacterium]